LWLIVIFIRLVVIFANICFELFFSMHVTRVLICNARI